MRLLVYWTFTWFLVLFFTCLCSKIKYPYAYAFGQNIETEGPSSLDGVIGSYSDAACHLERSSETLLSLVM